MSRLKSKDDSSPISRKKDVGGKQKSPKKPSHPPHKSVEPKPKSSSTSPSSGPTRAKRMKGDREVAPAGGMGTAMAAGAASEEVRQRLDDLQSRFHDLQESMLLTRLHSEMADIQTTLALLPTEVEKLRTRGYVFRNFLENKVAVLSEQWKELEERVSNEIEQRTRELERDSDAAESALRQAMSGHTSLMTRAESAVDTFESKVQAARSAIKAMYEPLEQNVHQTRDQVEEIRTLLDRIDEASFQLHPAEDPLASCRAQYLEREDEGPEGVLYLTDERLIFERKEEVATKKFLFITTEKETAQEFIFDVPIGQIEEIQASDERKFLKRKEMLELLFAPEADLSGATLRLIDAQNEDWVQLINRVRSGEIAKERTQPKDEAAVEAARTAPTKCPTCGATLSAEIVRGMREITCEYCGSVIRL